jgi:hypothetical protein
MPEETIAEEPMEEPARRRAPRKGLLQELLMRVEAQEEVIRQLGATFGTLSVHAAGGTGRGGRRSWRPPSDGRATGATTTTGAATGAIGAGRPGSDPSSIYNLLC